MIDADIESLHERIDALEARVLEELRAMQAQVPVDDLYCPRETVESYAERKGGTVAAPPGTVLCPGGFRLQLSRSNVKPDARKAADDFFHGLPGRVSFTASYAEGQQFTMRHHNVWRSQALTRDQAIASGLPGVRGDSDAAPAAPPGRAPGRAVVEAQAEPLEREQARANGRAPTPLFGGAGPADGAGAPAAAVSVQEATGRIVAWARKRWGAGLSVAEIMRAAGGGDWDAILERHGSWKAVAVHVGRSLSEEAWRDAHARDDRGHGDGV